MNNPTDSNPRDKEAKSTLGEREVLTRKVQYMVGRRVSSGFSPMSFGAPMGAGESLFDTQKILDALSAMPGVDVVRVIKPSSLAVLSASPSAATSDIVVVRTASQERAQYLETLAQRNPSLICERDYLLQHLGNFRPQLVGLPRGSSHLTTVSIPIRIHVQDDNGRALPNADVVIYGNSGTEDQGKTDAQGDVTIPVTIGFINEVAALYIKPAADYWETFIERPALDENAVNTVTLHPLNAFAQAGFPGNPFFGWGQRLMGLLGLDMQQCTGANARVAIIDSGCDTNHPALSHITIGRDYTNLDSNHEPDRTLGVTTRLATGRTAPGSSLATVRVDTSGASRQRLRFTS